MDISKSLAIAFKKKGTTKQHLCAETGISRMSLSNWGRGKPILSDHLEVICIYFDMKVSDFIRLGE